MAKHVEKLVDMNRALDKITATISLVFEEIVRQRINVEIKLFHRSSKNSVVKRAGQSRKQGIEALPKRRCEGWHELDKCGAKVQMMKEDKK